MEERTKKKKMSVSGIKKRQNVKPKKNEQKEKEKKIQLINTLTWCQSNIPLLFWEMNIFPFTLSVIYTYSYTHMPICLYLQYIYTYAYKK